MFDSILIIKLASLGDVLQTTTVLRELKRTQPQSRISWLVSEGNAGPLQNNPHLDEIIVLPSVRHWRKFFAVLFRLWKCRFDAAFIFHRSRILHALPFILQIPERVGFVTVGAESFFLTHPVPFDLRKPRLSRFFELLWHAGIARDMSQPFPSPELVPTPFALPAALSCGPFLVIAPLGAKNKHSEMPARRWPYFEGLIRLILKEWPDYKIALVGSIGERELLNQLTRLDERIVNFAGQCLPSQLAYLMSQSRGFIGNDSFPLFVAISQNIPSFGIFGPTDAELVLGGLRGVGFVQGKTPCCPCYDPTVPMYRSLAYHCPHGQACMTAMKPAEVFAQFQDFLTSNNLH